MSRFACPLRRRSLTGILVLLSLIKLAGAVRDQTSRPRLVDITFTQFRLVPIHSANRPASLGGAFLAITDETTAAAINPADRCMKNEERLSLDAQASQPQNVFSQKLADAW